MTSSLRTRLLLSYGLLIAVLVALFTIGSLVGLLRNPLAYENSAQTLRNAQRMIGKNPNALAAFTALPDPGQAASFASLLDVRVVLVKADGTTLVDSGANVANALRIPALRLKLYANRNEIVFMRDSRNRLWLTLVQVVDPQTYLVLAVIRPRLVFLELFNNELLRPMTASAGVGLALAVLIAFLMSRWISTPLRRMSHAADAVAAGKYQVIPLEGPDEVRHLAGSFNRMVKQVQDAMQSQRDLVANVSHELKTPLTSIQGFTQAIMDGIAQTPEQIQQAASVIQQEASRMSRLVQDLVTLARLEADAGNSTFGEVNVAELLKSVVEKFTPQAQQAGVNISAELAEIPLLSGDADRLVQVFSNLVDNAIKYTPVGGSVTVSAGRVKNDRVEVQVADSGPGIPAEDREKVFQRFYRRDESKPGVGLGLAIARQIVTAHGGQIWVEQNTPRGSIFVVSLPAMRK